MKALVNRLHKNSEISYTFKLFFQSSTTMMTSKRVLYRSKLPNFAFIILFLLVTFFIFTISIEPVALTEKKQDSRVPSLQKSAPQVIRNIIGLDRENHNSLVTSSRIGIVKKSKRKRVPEHEMFVSDYLTKKFHSRILEFFNHGCELRFFMTWISTVGSFGNREIIAVESVFKAHPNGCLTILSRSMDSIRGYRILKPLLDRGFKVRAVAPDFPFLVKNTPAENWFDDMEKCKMDPGVVPLGQNLSNLMRLLVLYKYGGVYLDTDFIVLNSFKPLKNTIGAQSIDVVSKNWTRLNNAVMVFDVNHPLVLKFIEEFALTFDGNKWGHNGPYMVSRVVSRVKGKNGFNFTVLPPMGFYPVDWVKIEGLFKMGKNRVGLKWVEGKVKQLKKQAYGVHLWNKQSSKLVVEKGSVMGRLMEDNCVLCEHIYSKKCHIVV